MVAYDSGSTSVRIMAPDAALAAPEKLTITPAASQDNVGPCGTWVLGPTGTTFNTPVTVAIRCPMEKAGGVLPLSYRIATLAGGKWSLLPLADGPAGFVTGLTTHFSEFAVVPEPVPKPSLLSNQCGQTFSAGGVTAGSSQQICVRTYRVQADEVLLTVEAGGTPQTTLTFDGLVPDTSMYVFDGSFEPKTPVRTDATGRLIFNQILGAIRHTVFLRRSGGTLDLHDGTSCDAFGAWDEPTRTCTLSQMLINQAVTITASNINFECLPGGGIANGNTEYIDILIGESDFSLPPITNVTVRGCELSVDSNGHYPIAVRGRATDIVIENNAFESGFVSIDLVDTARVAVRNNHFGGRQYPSIITAEVQLTNTSDSVVSDQTGVNAFGAEGKGLHLYLAGDYCTGNHIEGNSFVDIFTAIFLDYGSHGNFIEGNDFQPKELGSSTIELDHSGGNYLRRNTFNNAWVLLWSGDAEISRNFFWNSRVEILSASRVGVFLNDFHQSNVETLRGIALSDGARGNFWGHPCPGPYFVPGDATCEGSTTCGSLRDSFPYGVPVAAMDPATVPPPPGCQLLDADGDGYTADVDCDDHNPLVYPGAPELCDGYNTSCSGPPSFPVPDDEIDHDGDGYIPCSGWNSASPYNKPGLLGGGDCDDDDRYTYPGAPEACDGVANNCAGTVPWGEIDHDGDGYVTCCGWRDTGHEHPEVKGGCDPDDSDANVTPLTAGIHEYPVPQLFYIYVAVPYSNAIVFDGYPVFSSEVPQYYVQVWGLDLFFPGTLTLQSSNEHVDLALSTPYPGGSGMATQQNFWVYQGSLFAGDNVTATFTYPDGQTSNTIVLEPAYYPGTITGASVSMIVPVRPMEITLYGTNLYPQRFGRNSLDAVAQFANGNSAYPVPLSLLNSDPDGQWVTIGIPYHGLTEGVSVTLQLFLVLEKPSEGKMELLQFSLPMAPAVGEWSPRTHPRVSAATNWQRQRNVGTALVIRRSKSSENHVDVVLTTFTELNKLCEARMAPAGATLYSSSVAKVTTSAGQGADAFPWDYWPKLSVEGQQSLAQAACVIENIPFLTGLFSPVGCYIPNPDDLNRFLRHRAEFDALIPGAYYHYRVSCAHGPSETFDAANDTYFRVPPGPDEEQDVQAILTSDDIHGQTPASAYAVLGYDDVGTPSSTWQQNAAEESWVGQMMANGRDAGLMDFGLQAGDLVDEGVTVDFPVPTPIPGVFVPGIPGTVNAGATYFGYLNRYYSMNEPLLAATPVFSVAGNHDVKSELSGRLPVYDDMIDGPSDHSSDPSARQYFSFDWGKVHTLALDIIGAETITNGVDPFDPVMPQRVFFDADMQNVSAKSRWRIVMQHAPPWDYDTPNLPSDRCGSRLKDFCAEMNRFDVDLLFNGHTHGGTGLRRFLQSGGGPDDFVFSYDTAQGNSEPNTPNTLTEHAVLHIRFRKDAIILSRWWYGLSPTQNDGSVAYSGIPALLQSQPGIGALYECYKYVPGVRPSANAVAANCVNHTVYIKPRPFDGCSAPVVCAPHEPTNQPMMNPPVGASLNAESDGDKWVTPCCLDANKDGQCTVGDLPAQMRPPGTVKTVSLHPGFLVDYTSGQAVCEVQVQSCERDLIKPYDLRRQIIPIVTTEYWLGAPALGTDRYNADKSSVYPYYHGTGVSADLIKECTPCAQANGSIPPSGLGSASAVTNILSACGTDTFSGKP